MNTQTICEVQSKCSLTRHPATLLKTLGGYNSASRDSPSPCTGVGLPPSLHRHLLCWADSGAAVKST